jgi:hypothetical protein
MQVAYVGKTTAAAAATAAAVVSSVSFNCPSIVLHCFS